MSPEAKVVGIVQARMGSRRLPGKVLAPLGSSTVLEVLLERLRSSRLLTQHVVATTVLPEDDPIAVVSEKKGFATLRGSERDVLDRFYRVAVEARAEVVVRLTADNPLVDGRFVDWCLQQFFGSGLDYQAAATRGGFPHGLSVETMRASVLVEAWEQATEPDDREHVTKYIQDHGSVYRIGYIKASEDYSDLRWTIDTSDDLMRMQTLVKWLANQPEPCDWVDIARHDRFVAPN